MTTREQIIALARASGQAHGYSGLGFRELAKAIGIKSASIHYHFPAKADLGVAVLRDYCARAESDLAGIVAATSDPADRVARYAAIFRRTLENGNRMCLAGCLAAERLDLPEPVIREVENFVALNIAWLTSVLGDEARAAAVYAAIAGAQLTAHATGDIATYDRIIATYRGAGLLPP